MPAPARYDAVIIGGAFSGAAAALLLRRDHPHLRVLVVEKQERFDEKVGEATTEMSGMFLTRRLRLWEHLEREHLPKEGLRYWFTNERVRGHADASETGSYYRSAVPSFQLRRDVLDEHLISLARSEGAEVRRPARVREVEVHAPTDGASPPPFPEPLNRVTIEEGGLASTVACRWLIDASGRGTFLGRRLGIIDWNDEHPTAAAWARWRNVRHIDDLAAERGFAGGNIGSRRLGTNHYMGHGSWVWVIPLGNGETSIGVVYDKRIHNLHGARDRESAYEAFLRANPALAELLEGAEMRRGDFRGYSRLAYAPRRYMGTGWALVGDAAAFLDPYYSPGLDHAAFSVEATVKIVGEDAAGRDVGRAVARHNRVFVRSYHRFFGAVYRDKYGYMGEQDLLTASFLLDTAQYYLFLVIPAYRWAGRFLPVPVLGPGPAFWSYWLMSLYNRRFARLARLRREAGEGARRNRGRRTSVLFNLGLAAPIRMTLRGLRLWLTAEVDGLRLVLKRRRAPRPSAAGADAQNAGVAAEGLDLAARANAVN